MPEKEKRISFFDNFFDFGEDNSFFSDNNLQKSGSGYSISVTYDEQGKPIVRAKTYGDVDVSELRKSLEDKYPGAKIEGLDDEPLIRVVSEKEEGKEEKKPKKKQKSLIRIIE